MKPIPPEVRARLDPQLFRCDTCGAEMEYPARLCRTCKGVERRAQQARKHQTKGRRFWTLRGQSIAAPREELDEFKTLFGLPDDSFVHIPNYRRDPCVYCGKPGPNTLDHIVPYGAGGTPDLWRNAASACRDCNGRKESRPLFVFLQETWRRLNPKLERRRLRLRAKERRRRKRRQAEKKAQVQP